MVNDWQVMHHVLLLSSNFYLKSVGFSIITKNKNAHALGVAQAF
jgi:hypothetical protein